MNEKLRRLATGETVERISLENDRLSVDLLTLGSILSAVRLDGGPNMTAPPPDIFAPTGDEIFIGPIVGPVVNRLTVPVSVDGRDLDISPLGPEGYVLHSGHGSTVDRVWRIATQTATAVALTIDLDDGLGGFPGNRRIEAAWTLDGADLCLDIRATTDAPTLMNVAHHPYWALDGPDIGREWHRIASPATRYTPTTEVFTPTGDILPVAGSPYDFSIPTVPPPTLDANLCLDVAGGTPQLAATLVSDQGRRLDLLTTAPGLQVFTGKPYGIALEPQLWPNAPAHSEFPSILLEPDDEFRQQTIYRFSKV